MFFSLASLRKAKNLPQAGAVDAAVHAKARAQLLSALPDAVFESAPSQAGYVVGFMQSLVYKPVAATAAAFVFLAGGWMTTSAAQSSLPGDTLYNVKLIAERAQLQLASLDRRAVLHTEFAGRRLEEVAALQRAVEQEPNRAQYIAETVTAYQQEIASATTDLQALQTQDQAQALETATTVLNQVAVLSQNATELSVSSETTTNEDQSSQGSVTPEVAEQVTQTTEAIAEVATDVALDAHEASPSETSRREMENLFRNLLGSIEARRAMILHRIANIEEVTTAQKEILAQAGVILPKKEAFTTMTEIIEEMDTPLPTIIDNFAAGGYRTAVEALQEMDSELAGMENELTAIEESIVNALTQEQQQEEDSLESQSRDTSSQENTGTAEAALE